MLYKEHHIRTKEQQAHYALPCPAPEASPWASPPPLHTALLPRAPTEVVGDRPVRPVSARSGRECAVLSRCKPSSGRRPSAIGSERFGPSNSAKHAVYHSSGGGLRPRESLQANPRGSLQRHQVQVSFAVGHEQGPASPFGTHDEDAQDLALEDVALDVGYQHLLGMRDELLARGYIGPRHAI